MFNFHLPIKSHLIGTNTSNWVGSAQDRDYWSPCEYGIEPPDSISHVVSKSHLFSSLPMLSFFLLLFSYTTL